MESVNFNVAEIGFDEVDSLEFNEAVEFCKLILSDDKAVVNDFAFKVSNSQNPNVAKAICKYIASEEPKVRNLAGEILISMGKVAVEPLIEFIPGKGKHEIKFAVDVLGLIGDKRAEEPILDVLKSHTDENVILACIEALGNIRSEKAVPFLVNLYNVNEVFIPTIIEALGKIGSPEAMDLLMTAYKNQDALTKFTIIESLGNMGDETSFYFIYSELSKLEGPIVWAAVEAIYKLSKRLKIEIPFEEKFKAKLLETIYEGDEQYKKAAISLALNFDDKEILEAIFASIGTDEELDELLKDKLFNNLEYSLEVFGRYIAKNPPNIFPVLNVFEILFDYPGFNLLDYLSPLQLRSLENELENYLDSSHEEVRKSVMNLLFKIDPKEALLFLDKMMKDENIWNKLFLMDILETVPLDENAISVLRKFYDNEDEMIRERIDYLLSEITN